MNWDSVWPQVIAGAIVLALSALSANLYRKLRATRSQLGESRDVARRLRANGLTNFYQSRDDYARYRGAARLADYLAHAKRQIIISGYWLAQGTEMEGVADDIGRLLTRQERLTVTIVVIDPEANYAPFVAAHLRLTPDAVRSRARATIDGLTRLRNALTPEANRRLQVRTHSVYPIVSYIALDPDDFENARLQVDIKPYGLPRSSSIGFEFRHSSGAAYQSLLASCNQTVADSQET